MTDWREDSVDVGGARLSFSRRGHGPSGVVVLHGQLGDRTLVQPLVQALEGPSIVTPDIRGRGSTVCRDVELHDWARYSADVTSLLDHLELTGAVLVGVSLGAGVAIATALAHPDRVDGLMLWASPYRGQRRGWSDDQRAVQGRVIETARRVLDEGAAVIAGEDARAVRRWNRHDLQSIAAALVGIGWSQPFDDVSDLNAISAPTVVIAGSDALHAPELAIDYVDALPRGVLGRASPTAVADFITTL